MVSRIQIRRTISVNNPPPNGYLQQGELCIELANAAPKLWVGTPTSPAPFDATGRRVVIDASLYLPFAGGTMTGPLVLAADPAAPMQAVTQQWVTTNYAPLNSPAFTGTPTAPTPPAADASTRLATTQFVKSASASLAVSDTPPAVTNGAMWFDSVGVQLYVGYNDGTSTQWVIANNLGALGMPVGVPQGGTGATSLTANSILKGGGTTPITISSISDAGTGVRIGSPPGAAVGAGSLALPGPVVINANAAALPASTTGHNTLLRLGASDGTTTGALLDSWNNIGSAVSFRQARGTAATQTATQSADWLGYIEGFGRGASGYATGASALIAFQAGENFTDTAHGTNIVFATTPPGSTSINLSSMTLDGSGNLTVTGNARATNYWTPDTSTASTGSVGFSNANGPRLIFYGSTSGGGGAVGVNSATGANMLVTYPDGSMQIFNSTATKPGGGSWVAPSDRSLKSTVNNWGTGLAEILRLEPLSYQYRNEAWNHPEQHYIGLDAQDAALVIPEMERSITISEDGQFSGMADPEPVEVAALDHTPLIFALVNAVKELSSQVNDLRQQLHETKLP